MSSCSRQVSWLVTFVPSFSSPQRQDNGYMCHKVSVLLTVARQPVIYTRFLINSGWTETHYGYIGVKVKNRESKDSVCRENLRKNFSGCVVIYLLFFICPFFAPCVICSLLLVLCRFVVARAWCTIVWLLSPVAIPLRYYLVYNRRVRRYAKYRVSVHCSKRVVPLVEHFVSSVVTSLFLS